jgi:hypothetical protein
MLLALPLLAALPALASAGLFFGKKATKPDPATRVPELIVTVKTDGDENKRAAAAEELRQYDPASQPDIIPVLIDVLLHDAKPSVRAEAAQSLGKMRPINQQAGWALEQAVSNDSSMRVRVQARSALLLYHMSGYHGTKTDEPPAENAATKNKEPAPTGPLPPAVKTTTAPPPPPPQHPANKGRLAPTPVQPAGVPGQSAEPPLAPEIPDPGPAKPMSSVAPQTPLVPTEAPALQKAPPAPSEDGPALTPP